MLKKADQARLLKILRLAESSSEHHECSTALLTANRLLSSRKVRWEDLLFSRPSFNYNEVYDRGYREGRRNNPGDPATWRSGYENGYEKGSKEGYESGLRHGKEHGYLDGYNAGVQVQAMQAEWDRQGKTTFAEWPYNHVAVAGLVVLAGLILGALLICGVSNG